jgi:gentisate 1,2-dioxygenase
MAGIDRETAEKVTLEAIQDLEADLEQVGFKPFWGDWLARDPTMPAQPRTQVVPHVWRAADYLPRLRRAGTLVDTTLAERRSLMLMNPGLDGKPFATQTLMAAVQLVLPGEIAACHRHSAAAFRFILQGEGAYTAVDGEKFYLRPGDFVITPNWTWHDHGNESAEPVVWMDGLDIPLVNSLNVGFYEALGEPSQPITRPIGDGQHRFGAGLTPTWQRHLAPYSPLFHYSWERAYAALRAIASADQGSPFDGVLLEYTNPCSGGSALPTMATRLQMLPPGVHTLAHRHTASTVYLVARGRGTTIVDGRALDWSEHDLFVVPTWAWHQHRSDAAEESILFSFTDEPTLRALALYREEERR